MSREFLILFKIFINKTYYIYQINKNLKGRGFFIDFCPEYGILKQVTIERI